MAKNIYAYMRTILPSYATVDGYAVKKIALDWAIDTGEDIAEALSSDTINQVLALMGGGE